MKKPLSLRIAQRVQQSTLICSTNRAVFRSLQFDIKQALEDGWSFRSIWETLHAEGNIRFSYPTFCKYTHQFIKTFETSNTTSSPHTQAPKSTLPGFTFRPHVDKKELL